MKLIEKPWAKIGHRVPEGAVRGDGKGRPWKDKVVESKGVLWIVKTSAR